MTGFTPNLTPGHLARHAPGKSAQGREAALIDVAQDLLLRELADVGVLSALAFKGGTAIRKVYAGASGRFSTDLDFAVRNLADDPSTVLDLIAEACDGLELGGIRFSIEERRGKLHLSYASDLVAGTGALSSKLDVGPPPWLTPEDRAWVPLPIHDRYGGLLPHLPVVRVEETVAEKIARLTRRTYARDAYDLVWIARQPGLALNQALVRRLAVLKCWVDLHGLTAAHHAWSPAHGPLAFDVDRWLRPRIASEFDDEQIGLLTTPPPDLDELGADLPRYYSWLGDLDEDERAIAAGAAGDRALVLRLLGELPGARLADSVW
jgi:predicted nucleotidyltransferase component of viral defense system